MRPSERDAHLGLVDEVAFRTVRDAVGTLEHLGAGYVLAGGWPVFAYGSRVPSVDTDVFLRRADAPAFRAAFRASFPDEVERVDLLDLEGLNAVLGPDVELGEPDEGYVPADLLRGRTRRARLPLAGHPLEATIPTAEALAATKLKAFHDRALAWAAVREPSVMARIPPVDRPAIREKAESYWYRKAGKDLYDIAFLATHACELEGAFQLLPGEGLRHRLREPWAHPPVPLVRMALDLAEGDGPTSDFLRARPAR